VQNLTQMAQSDIESAPFPVRIFSLLGRVDLAFEAMERYFFDRGSFGAASPIGPMTRRYTDFLFSGGMAAVHADPRFRQLTQELGLEAYWHDRGMRRPSFPS